MKAIRPVNWLKIGILGMIWGASFMAVSVALEGIGPLLLVATRLVLGAVFVMAIAQAHTRGRGLPSIAGREGKLVWFSALLIAIFSNALPFTLLSWGQQYVASGFAGVCMAVVPLFVLPLAHFLVPGEMMNLRRLIGFVIGTLGVVVLIGPAAFEATGVRLEPLARLACVGAAGGYAVGSIVTRLCPPVSMLALSAAALMLSAAIFTPYALWMEGLPARLDLAPLLALLYLGIFPTGVAQMILVSVIRDAGPVFMSLVNYQVPVWSVILGAAFLSEALPSSLLLALTLILGGVALSQAGALRRLFLRR